MSSGEIIEILWPTPISILALGFVIAVYLRMKKK